MMISKAIVTMLHFPKNHRCTLMLLSCPTLPTAVVSQHCFCLLNQRWCGLTNTYSRSEHEVLLEAWQWGFLQISGIFLMLLPLRVLPNREAPVSLDFRIVIGAPFCTCDILMDWCPVVNLSHCVSWHFITQSHTVNHIAVSGISSPHPKVWPVPILNYSAIIQLPQGFQANKGFLSGAKDQGQVSFGIELNASLHRISYQIHIIKIILSEWIFP